MLRISTVLVNFSKMMVFSLQILHLWMKITMTIALSLLGTERIPAGGGSCIAASHKTDRPSWSSNQQSPHGSRRSDYLSWEVERQTGHHNDCRSWRKDQDCAGWNTRESSRAGMYYFMFIVFRVIIVCPMECI